MKKINLVFTAVFSLCLSLSAQASLTGEALDYLRMSINSTKKEALAQTSEQLLKSSSSYSKLIKNPLGENLDQADSLILLKKPIFKGTKLAPGLIIRRGLYQDLNQPAEQLWIGVVLTKKAEPKLQAKFNEAISAVVKENPAFSIEFVMLSKMLGMKEYEILGNVNLTQLEFLSYNFDRAIISGQEMIIANIPISKFDNVEDALELIKMLDKKLEL